jgi:hypothetical protein
MLRYTRNNLEFFRRNRTCYHGFNAVITDWKLSTDIDLVDGTKLCRKLKDNVQEEFAEHERSQEVLNPYYFFGYYYLQQDGTIDDDGFLEVRAFSIDTDIELQEVAYPSPGYQGTDPVYNNYCGTPPVGIKFVFPRGVFGYEDELAQYGTIDNSEQSISEDFVYTTWKIDFFEYISRDWQYPSCIPLLRKLYKTWYLETRPERLRRRREYDIRYKEFWGRREILEEQHKAQEDPDHIFNKYTFLLSTWTSFTEFEHTGNKIHFLLQQSSALERWHIQKEVQSTRNGKRPAYLSDTDSESDLCSCGTGTRKSTGLFRSTLNDILQDTPKKYKTEQSEDEYSTELEYQGIESD